MMIRELQEEKAARRARVAELEAAREAMLAVCTDADPHDRTYPYVCLAESGNPIIEAATLADAIRQLARWGDAGYAKAAKAEAQLATARAEERERCAGVICLACRSGLPRTERDGRWTHDFDCAHDTYNPNGYDWDFCPADALHRLTPEPRHD